MAKILFLALGVLLLADALAPAFASSCTTTCTGSGNYRTCNTYCY